jgi:hypothetical protein
MLARETALARVQMVERLNDIQEAQLKSLAERVSQHLSEWHLPDPGHAARVQSLRTEWAQFLDAFNTQNLQDPYAVATLLSQSKTGSLDLQELVVALVLEPFGDLVDGLAECMTDPYGAMVLPAATTDEVRQHIETHAQWALRPDYDAPQECGQFWYVSAAKQEPRLGARFAEPGSEWESPLDVGRRIKALYQDLPRTSAPVSDFLERHPDHALAVRRVAALGQYPYGEIRDNVIAEGCLPIDMLRCKLAFFGASKFDPKSDRWTRITLCQGAPLADEIDTRADDWWMPVFGA